jgi:hypothetical protein
MNAVTSDNRAVFNAFAERANVQNTTAKKVWLLIGIAVFGLIDIGVMYATMHAANVDAMGNPTHPPLIIACMATVSLCVFIAIKMVLDKENLGRWRYLVVAVLASLIFSVVLYCLWQEKGMQVAETVAANAQSGIDTAFDAQTGAAAGMGNNSMSWLVGGVLALEAMLRLIPGSICVLLGRSWGRMTKTEAEAKLALSALGKFQSADKVHTLIQSQTELKQQLPTQAPVLQEGAVLGAIEALRTKMSNDLQGTQAQLNGQTILDGHTKQALEQKRQRLESMLARTASLH